ncbi:MAG: hypothetical protein LBR36_00430 [Bacteroidales bacterium]|jgi:predicted LPLAT superfamily acyltransferase|nr:hypothetical protein [Bacteroidales bacterium]
MIKKQVKETQWQGKTSGGKLGQRFLFFVLARIKVNYLYPILYIIIPFYFILGDKNCKIIYQYFRKRHNYSKLQSLKSTFFNYLLFGKVVLDKFALFAGNTAQFKVHIHQSEEATQKLQSSKGLILAGAHVGNFEIAALCLQIENKNISSVVYANEATILQQKRKKTYLNLHLNLIEIQEDMSHLIEIKKTLEAGNIISISCDRLVGSYKKFTFDFLGKKADFPSGIFYMSNLLNINMLSVFVMKGKSLHYHVYIEPLQQNNTQGNNEDKAKYLAQQYVGFLEKMLKKYPRQWFNYYNFWQENEDIR